jgi:Protein of unknown function (DUF3263)
VPEPRRATVFEASPPVSCPAVSERNTLVGLMGLTARDRDILDFERTWWTKPGSKEATIRTELGMSGTRYYELLRSLLDNPAAYEHDPLLVKRLRRQRDRRRRERIEGHADPGLR